MNNGYVPVDPDGNCRWRSAGDSFEAAKSCAEQNNATLMPGARRMQWWGDMEDEGWTIKECVTGDELQLLREQSKVECQVCASSYDEELQKLRQRVAELEQQLAEDDR